MAVKRMMHPVSVVVFVPIEVEDLEECDGLEFLPTPSGVTPLITSRMDAEKAVTTIGMAAMRAESVGLALDALLVAARQIQELVPGTDVQGTAWFGGAEFQEM